MGSTWGNAIKISIFGESHGAGIGVVIDGFPSGVMYDEAFVLREMERRAPGRNRQSTARKEADRPEIQSGIYNGKTTGTPICAVIRNTNQRSGDYAELAAQPRPGHADYTGMLRYKSCNDPRGGGHFSGRLTAPLVFAGALCKLWLRGQGVTVGSHIQSIAQIQDMPFDDVEVTGAQLDALREQEYPVINPRALDAMLAAIEDAREEQDSVGGVIECAAVGLPAGIGSPMLDSVESRLASILFGVPAVKGVEFGAGFAFAALRGYYDLVHAKEAVPESRRPLSDDEARALDDLIANLDRGDVVRCRYYEGGGYREAEGAVSQIDVTFRDLWIVRRRIPFSAIQSLELLYPAS